VAGGKIKTGSKETPNLPIIMDSQLSLG